MQNGNAVSMWLVGAKRTRTTAQIVAYATEMERVDVDGREFWVAVRAVAERTK
jgi:hypothetical protein